jgi:Tol biopolymer transport system component
MRHAIVPWGVLVATGALLVACAWACRTLPSKDVATGPPAAAPAGFDSAWPQFSPDGRSLVFASTRENDDWEIDVMQADGTGATRLTHSPGRDAHPIFTPDGTSILFQSPRGGAAGSGAAPDPNEVDLYVMDADGGHQRPLITGPGFDGVPCLSRDGRTLAYMHGTPRGDKLHWEIRLANADGTNDRALTSGVWSSQVPVFDPAGGRIALHADPHGRNQLFLMDLATRVLTTLAASNGVDEVPSFSPDGRYVAFTSTRHGARDLYRVEIATGAVKQLTDNRDVWSQGGWSPDGRQIAFSARVRGHDEIFLVESDADVSRGGPAPVQLTHGSEGRP